MEIIITREELEDINRILLVLEQLHLTQVQRDGLNLAINTVAAVHRRADNNLKKKMRMMPPTLSEAEEARFHEGLDRLMDTEAFQRENDLLED